MYYIEPPAAEVTCLTEVMFFEARDQGDIGMEHVARTVLKRVAIKYRGDDTICSVVHRWKQFSYLWDKVPDVVVYSEFELLMEIRESAYKFAEQYYNGTLPDYEVGHCQGGATHYHRYDTLPSWAVKPGGSMRIRCGQHGAHVFYIGR